ncbi:unnamed protein product [Zymoseptoria tritici ST99CH_1A5]|uniref:Carboxylic ester hydrolase n=1 Tax=Zymoseptoria tritici ST99CH_1A5 TaxID=1276529 RepID=A0A1Y6LAH8_ZYMTR|nr:unnamed protein product [Zymoseptoria tritici ST99CH_1A5]
MFRTFGLLSLAGLLLRQSSAVEPTDNSSPIVHLDYASYRGNASFEADFNTHVFYGLRYAQAPTGELRWQPPRPIEGKNNYSTNGIIDAQALGPACTQGSPKWVLAFDNISTSDQINTTYVIGEEDCLLLDIYVPSHPKSKSLPVLAEIHGGGYTRGQNKFIHGESIVNASQGEMIFVAMQYRLGAYGFLSSEEVRENGVANAGLLDQRAALEWIQRNIAKFGGDPSKVTITGGSAGGGSVVNQMIMHGGVASPPFRAALPEYPWWQPYHNDTILERQYRSLLKYAKCDDLQCLRSLDSDRLEVASAKTYFDGETGYGDYYYGPSVDGSIIRDLPSNELKQGHFSKVPLLTDHARYEGTIFTDKASTTEVQVTDDAHHLFPYAGQDFFDRLYQLYPLDAYNSTFFQRQQFFGDFIISCPTYYMASASADAGLPTYKLIFDAGTQQHEATFDFIYMPSSSTNNATIADYMKDWVISFTVHMDPNEQSFTGASGKPYWPMYNTAMGTANASTPEFAIMSVNYTQVGSIMDPDVSAQCDFFHSSSYDTRN